jgi:hypothetical protein
MGVGTGGARCAPPVAACKQIVLAIVAAAAIGLAVAGCGGDESEPAVSPAAESVAAGDYLRAEMTGSTLDDGGDEAARGERGGAGERERGARKQSAGGERDSAPEHRPGKASDGAADDRPPGGGASDGREPRSPQAIREPGQPPAPGGVASQPVGAPGPAPAAPPKPSGPVSDSGDSAEPAQDPLKPPQVGGG